MRRTAIIITIARGGQNRLPGYLPGLLWAIAAHAEVERQNARRQGQAVIRRLVARLEHYRDPKGGLWERPQGRERKTWKSAASQGLYAYLVATLPEGLRAQRRLAQAAISRLPPPSEPDDAALALLARRLLKSSALIEPRSRKDDADQLRQVR